MSGIAKINHSTTHNDDIGKEDFILSLKEVSIECKSLQQAIWKSKENISDKFFLARLLKELEKILNVLQSDLPEEKKESKGFFIFFSLIFYLSFYFLTKGMLLSFLFSYLRTGIKSDRKQSLVDAPGSRWLSLVTFLFSRITVEETFKPMVGLWREEYYQAIKEGKKLQARWISIRETYNFVIAMILRNPLGDLLEFLAKFVKYNL